MNDEHVEKLYNAIKDFNDDKGYDAFSDMLDNFLIDHGYATGPKELTLEGVKVYLKAIEMYALKTYGYVPDFHSRIFGIKTDATTH